MSEADGQHRPLGRVTLIGAGPGDPDLLTVRAVERLADADLVLYDALSSPEVRRLASEARWFYVGKRARRESIAQDTINRLMIREARRGHHVVRLKAGDPFILGRGGEEALALCDAGIPFEVVPGVSSVIAAPALAGIPLTHRGLASAFVVVSGHARAAWEPVCSSLAPGSATVVALMAKRARGDIAAHLLARGWPRETPAALVLGAATPQAWRWVGRLDQVGQIELPASPAAPVEPGLQVEAPGMLVVGAVVSLSDVLASPAAVAVAV